ncbi:MAG: hypothetical protein AAGA44_06270 [Pseudomonadota bacterium]
MDNLAKRLRDDAEAIKADVSPQLESRIQASLEAVVQERPATVEAPRTERSALFWWASSLTGIAAATALILMVNTNTVDPVADNTVANQVEPALQLPELPRLPLKVEAAMTTTLLEQELENIQSDLQRAAKAVENDVDRIIDRGDSTESDDTETTP